MKSFFSLIEAAAEEIPDKPLYVFPKTRWNSDEVLTYGNLRTQAGAAQALIAQNARAGDRALLLLPTGAAFWECFVACLSLGVIAVPLKIPNLNRTSESPAEICRDCSPSLLITDESTAQTLQRHSESHPHLTRLPMLTPAAWRQEASDFTDPRLSGDPIAFLQYTSGSTACPKGVRISQANLSANIELIRQRMEIRSYEDCGVTWLPHYHDMGLIGSYLTALYTRTTSYCFPPEEFAIRPATVLEQISKSRANLCGGPDFSYRLCVDKIDPEQLAGIDLSSWRVAYVGAERIRASTLRRFAEKFAPCGFQSRAFFPCYGLAEATLMATGGPASREPCVRRVSSAALMGNQIQDDPAADDTTELVGCGQTIAGLHLLILDSVTGEQIADETIGEVFICGPSVTQGYFNQDPPQDGTFRNVTIDGVTRRFLRTGDLGFLSAGELFITGRLKETMIVRGRNLSPEDVEQRIENLHEALMPGGAVAFSVEQNGEECVIVAAEIKRTAVRMEQPEMVIAAIRNQIVLAFGVNPGEVILLRPATIPRTSSGKPRRLAVRDQYVAGTIEVLMRERG